MDGDRPAPTSRPSGADPPARALSQEPRDSGQTGRVRLGDVSAHAAPPPADLLAKYKDKVPDAGGAAYYAMCDWFDPTAGELLDHLDRQELTDNTMVVYLADNGWHSGSGPMRGHKLSVYEGGIRTPLMVKHPGRLRPCVSDEPVMRTDIAPTVLSAWGIHPTPAMRGVNLLEAAGGWINRDVICGAGYQHGVADWDDPAKNLAADNTDTVRRLRDRLEAWWKQEVA
jgi:arylsulfatase A-like enzyme